MMAVPFMFTVMPRGSTKEATDSSTPSSWEVVSMFSGRAAALEEVEKPNSATLEIFLMKGMGSSLAPRRMISA